MPICSRFLFMGGMLALSWSACQPEGSSPQNNAPTQLEGQQAMAQQGLPRRAASSCDGPDTLDFTIEGYGQATLGGWQPGHDVYCVTSLADNGPGSLREGLNTGDAPRVIRFGVDGVIPLASPLDIPSHISLDGRGRQVILQGKGLWIHGREEVIITHLALEDVQPSGEDGIQVGWPEAASRRVVLDHLRFTQHGELGNSEYVDEAVSVIFGSREITIAWCRFEDWEKLLLFGNGDASPEVDGQISVTVHHNYFDSAGRRHPMARLGQFDIYNNFLYDWRMFTRPGPPIYHESFGIRCQEDCRMIVEQNIFERYAHLYDHLSTANMATYCKQGGMLDDRGSYVTPETEVSLRFNVGCALTDLERPYQADVDIADNALMQRLVAETGPGF